MAHGVAREGKWRGNWRMEWVASTLRTTSEHDVSSISTADAHTSAASSRLNWHPSRFKWTRTFRRKTKSGFCACAITFQTQSTYCIAFVFRAGGYDARNEIMSDLGWQEVVKAYYHVVSIGELMKTKILQPSKPHLCLYSKQHLTSRTLKKWLCK